MVPELDSVTFGRRLRHLRRQRGLTLADLAVRVGKGEPFLSMLENGKREARLSLVNALAGALQVPAAELLSSEPPSHRAELEIQFARAQSEPLYKELALPAFALSTRLPDEALEHILGLYRELKARSSLRAATPEEARRSNAELREEMRRRDNYFAEIEQEAAAVLAAVGYSGSGALAQRSLDSVAAHFGFSVHPVPDLPRAVRSVSDLEHRRIFIPQRDALPPRVARSVVLQTLGHFALGHSDPRSFADFLRQRVEANYFAAALLAPEQAAVPLLQQAKRERDLSPEDLQETFYISYEMAGHRFTNLATRHLGMRTHFVRSDEEGIIWKAYENDGVPFPRDPDGAIEGLRMCRQWGARRVFSSADKFAANYQFVDTPAGTFWCVTRLEVDADDERDSAVTVGVGWEDARYFRGRNTERRFVSACPDGDCCRRPPAQLRRWEGQVWPSTRAHSHVLAALPAGSFPGVDMTDIYEFLERHPAGLTL